MRVSFALTCKHAVAAVVLVLMLVNIGRLYQHAGEKHTLLYVGTRHVWRYGLQSVKDVRWQWRENYPDCRSLGGTVSGCLAKVDHWSVDAVLTDRPIVLARQFVGLQNPEIIRD
jgi:hypothetical protein